MAVAHTVLGAVGAVVVHIHNLVLIRGKRKLKPAIVRAMSVERAQVRKAVAELVQGVCQTVVAVAVTVVGAAAAGVVGAAVALTRRAVRRRARAAIVPAM